MISQHIKGQRKIYVEKFFISASLTLDQTRATITQTRLKVLLRLPIDFLKMSISYKESSTLIYEISKFLFLDQRKVYQHCSNQSMFHSVKLISQVSRIPRIIVMNLCKSSTDIIINQIYLKKIVLKWFISSRKLQGRSERKVHCLRELGFCIGRPPNWSQVSNFLTQEAALPSNAAQQAVQTAGQTPIEAGCGHC